MLRHNSTHCAGARASVQHSRAADAAGNSSAAASPLCLCAVLHVIFRHLAAPSTSETTQRFHRCTRRWHQSKYNCANVICRCAQTRRDGRTFGEAHESAACRLVVVATLHHRCIAPIFTFDWISNHRSLRTREVIIFASGFCASGQTPGAHRFPLCLFIDSAARRLNNFFTPACAVH